MELLTILAVGTLCIVCFLIGANVGQKVAKGEDIELPTLNPMKAIREHQDRKEAEREQDEFETLMYNIDHYRGDSIGQRDLKG